MNTKVHKSFESTDKLSAYITDHSIRLTPVQKKLMDITLKHSNKGYMGAPEVLQIIQNMIFAIGAKKVLDIGVFTGCSALAEALALPEDGKVVACDVSEEYANIGKPFWEEAGVAYKIDLRIAPASDTLDKLIANGEEGTYDVAFIDHNKADYHNSYEKCLKLLRSRGVIIVDNVLWSGAVLDENDQSESTKAIREFNDKIKNDFRVKINMFNVGDGVTLAFKI